MKSAILLRFPAFAMPLFATPAVGAPGTAGPDAGFGWTAEPLGILALAIFVLAYGLVVFEERTRLRKSKPVMLAAALIWGLIGIGAATTPGVGADAARVAFEHVFLEFAALFFFLVVAMTYVSALTERNVFEALRAALVSRGFSYRQLFWLTGLIAFFLSAVLDNLTTALVMAGVVLAVGAGNARFISLAFVNLVVAANAGGAWSAFGDITTLMVWQAGKLEFFEFFRLFLPSAVNWLVPAALMHYSVPQGRPALARDDADIRYGGLGIAALFGITIAVTVAGKQLLHLPAVYGMMAGLALLQIWAWRIARHERASASTAVPQGAASEVAARDAEREYSVFRILARAEWDTLLFFYGVLMCVGGLAAMGFLAQASHGLYGGLGHTWANVALGLASAIVDNIPIMYAVLQMEPALDPGQWLLITLTTGVGGSLLAVGSAAGVALMGQSRGQYTFSSHLRWSWAIALGYIASVAVHLWWNAAQFSDGVWR